MDHGYVLFCSGHTSFLYSKKNITLLLTKLIVIEVSLAIVVVFGEIYFIWYMIAIPLSKYWNTPEVFINFDVGRENIFDMI